MGKRPGHGNSGWEKVRLARAAVAQGSGCGARTAESGSVRARSCRVSWLVQAVAVATATGGYGQRRGRCSEAQGGGSWNGNGSGLGRDRETGG